MTVTVPALRRNVRGLAIPFGVWVAFRGGRALCRGCQRAMRLVPGVLPLSEGDTRELLARPLV